MENITIVDGPDRFSLFTSLVEMSPLDFRLNVGHSIELVVVQMELESGDGQSFILRLRRPDKNAYVAGYYSTKHRKGLFQAQ